MNKDVLSIFEQDINEGFFSFSKDRTFFFKFNNNMPSRVYKIGDYDSLYREYKNHRFALTIIPENVPQLIYFKIFKTKAILCMEYVANKLFFDVISSKLFKKQHYFFKKVEEIFSFLLVWLNELPTKKIFVEELGHSYQMVDIMAEEDKENYAILKGNLIPCVPQHRDFSLANIRYSKKGFVVLDWEDLEENDFITSDFSMLWFSVFRFYQEFFGKNILIDNRDWFVSLFNKTMEWVVNKYDLEPEAFKRLLVLSLYSLVVQNKNKDRTIIAEDILNFLNLIKDIV